MQPAGGLRTFGLDTLCTGYCPAAARLILCVCAQTSADYQRPGRRWVVATEQLDSDLALARRVAQSGRGNSVDAGLGGGARIRVLKRAQELEA